MRHPAARPDINITPLIDVMLVLLVIFLAALPLTQKAIDASLPPAQAHEGPPPGGAQIVLEYSADGRIAVNQQPVERSALAAMLTEIYRVRRDKTMYIMGAGTLRYGAIMGVIDAAKGAGVDRVGIVTAGMRRAATRS